MTESKLTPELANMLRELSRSVLLSLALAGCSGEPQPHQPIETPTFSPVYEQVGLMISLVCARTISLDEYIPLAYVSVWGLSKVFGKDGVFYLFTDAPEAQTYKSKTNISPALPTSINSFVSEIGPVLVDYNKTPFYKFSPGNTLRVTLKVGPDEPDDGPPQLAQTIKSAEAVIPDCG